MINLLRMINTMGIQQKPRRAGRRRRLIVTILLLTIFVDVVSATNEEDNRTSLVEPYLEVHPIDETSSPTTSPSMVHSQEPSVSVVPTSVPPPDPTLPPTISTAPTNQPTTSEPSNQPTTSEPTSSQAPTDIASSDPSDVPTSAPSLPPSSHPTLVPSPSPTYKPSPVPSTSTSPSMQPSDVPTLSLRPSSVPSSSPSLAPTLSLQPTLTASNQPSLSLSPSTFPSDSPSDVPTLSAAPSQPPSSQPSLSAMPTTSAFPSFYPSDTPSDVPSAGPTISDQPTVYPSEAPSDHPTLSPSSAPSSEPSRAPSPSPSANPSSYPSSPPSARPTSFPSEEPSNFPSESPSAFPSASPSASPTLVCHDISTYRSPINDLTCDDHRGTNCIKWLGLGLTSTELGTLVESCPQACDIECGSFAQYAVPVSFHLTGIPRLLDSSSKKKLEETALDFIGSWVESVERDLIFFLEYVELTAQSFATTPAPSRNLRFLQEQPVEVKLRFDGFTVGKTTSEVSNMIVSGIDSPQFNAELRASDEFFADAVVSSASEVDVGSEVDVKEDERAGASTATIVVTTMVSVSIFIFGLGALCFHRRSGRWVPDFKLPPLRDASVGEHDLHGSPRHSQQYSSQTGSPRNMLSQPGSLLSFDESPVSGVLATGANSLVRLIASLSLSRSKSSTDIDDAGSRGSAGAGAVGTTGGRHHAGAIAIISPMSDESEEPVQQEHPLANIIPPMIVIDNIDEEHSGAIASSNGRKSNNNSHHHFHDSSSSSFFIQKKNLQVPSKRVAASTEFKTALSDSRTKPESSNSFAGMLYNSTIFSTELDVSAWSNVDDQNRVMSPLGIIVDSESEDDYSVASTPVSSKSPKALVPLRRTLSSSALDVAETSIHTEDLFSPRSLDMESPRFSPPPSIGRERDLDEQWLDVPAEDEYDHAETDSLELGLGPERPPPVEYRSTSTNSANEWQLPPIHPTTPERTSRTTHNSPNDSGRLINSLWSLSPIAKAFKESTPRTIRRPSLPKKSDFSLNKRKTSAEASEQSDDDMHNSNGNSNSSSNINITFGFGNSSHNASRSSVLSNNEHNEAEYTTRFEFEAPRKGQLGLVIESSNKTGPTVHAVKDYSPLFGLVRKGDKIVEVDGRRTSQSTLTEITKLLSVRPTRRSANLRIVVSRSTMERSGDWSSSSVNHTRDSSYGSSSIASSKMLEDVDIAASSDGGGSGSGTSGGGGGSFVEQSTNGTTTQDDLVRYSYYNHEQQQQQQPQQQQGMNHLSSQPSSSSSLPPSMEQGEI